MNEQANRQLVQQAYQQVEAGNLQSRKVTKWLFWVVSLSTSNPRAKFPPQLGRMSGQSKVAK